MPSKNGMGIYPDIHYFRTMMISGFLKSTVGTGFISIGTTIIFMGLATPTYNENSIYIGVTAMAIGALIYFAGDIYKTEQKKKEVKVIDDRIVNVKEETESQIKLEAEKVARIIIEEEEEKKQMAIKKRLAEMEQGICGDIIGLSNKEQAGYCHQRAYDFQILAYPDDYPASEMVEIAIKKAEIRGEIPNKDYLIHYFNTLYNDGLITEKKKNKCIGGL